MLSNNFELDVIKSENGLSPKESKVGTEPIGERPFECTDKCLEEYFNAKDNLEAHRRWLDRHVTLHLMKKGESFVKCEEKSSLHDESELSLTSNIKDDVPDQPSTSVAKAMPFDTDRDDATVESPGKVNCNICGRMIVARSIGLHMNSHIPTPFQCTFKGCVQTFAKSADALKQHVSGVHEFANITPRPEAICPVCNRTVRALKLHMKTHTPTPFPCTYGCTQVFARSKAGLCCHRAIFHKDRRPDSKVDFHKKKMAVLLCEICGKSARGLHMIVHKPTAFPCTNGCIKTFSVSAAALATHRSIYHRHLSQAKKSSTDSSKVDQSVSSRKRRSIGSLPTVKPGTTCTVCSKFVGVNMTSHMLKHDSEGKPFICVLGCIKTFFGTAEELEVHVRGEHRPSRRSLEKKPHVEQNGESDDDEPVVIPRSIRETQTVQMEIKKEMVSPKRPRLTNVINEMTVEEKKAAIMKRILGLPETATRIDRLLLIDEYDACM